MLWHTGPVQYMCLGDVSQHTDTHTSQHTYQNQENTSMSVMQVSILWDKSIQRYPWVIQVKYRKKHRSLIQVSILYDKPIKRYP